MSIFFPANPERLVFRIVISGKLQMRAQLINPALEGAAWEQSNASIPTPAGVRHSARAGLHTFAAGRRRRATKMEGLLAFPEL